jgi:hypothetical protein
MVSIKTTPEVISVSQITNISYNLNCYTINVNYVLS